MPNPPSRSSSLFPQRVKTPVFSFIIEHSVSIKALNMSVSALETWTFCFCCFLLCFIKQQWYTTFILAQAWSRYHLPSTQKDRNSLLWCGGMFLHSDRGSAAHNEARDCRRGSALHSCQHTHVKRQMAQMPRSPSPTVLCINSECSDRQQATWMWVNMALILTRLPSTPVRRCTLLSRGCRWRHWDTGRVAGMPCHSNPAHRAPHNAIPGTRQCRHRHPWWGYTLPHFGIDTDYCSGGPSSRSRSLQAQREVASDRGFILENIWTTCSCSSLILLWITPCDNSPTLQNLFTFVILYYVCHQCNRLSQSLI